MKTYLLIKATSTKTVTVPAHTRSDGTYVAAYQKTVRFNPDKAGKTPKTVKSSKTGSGKASGKEKPAEKAPASNIFGYRQLDKYKKGSYEYKAFLNGVTDRLFREGYKLLYANECKDEFGQGTIYNSVLEGFQGHLKALDKDIARYKEWKAEFGKHEDPVKRAEREGEYAAMLQHRKAIQNAIANEEKQKKDGTYDSIQKSIDGILKEICDGKHGELNKDSKAYLDKMLEVAKDRDMDPKRKAMALAGSLKGNSYFGDKFRLNEGARTELERRMRALIEHHLKNYPKGPDKPDDIAKKNARVPDSIKGDEHAEDGFRQAHADFESKGRNIYEIGYMAKYYAGKARDRADDAEKAKNSKQKQELMAQAETFKSYEKGYQAYLDFLKSKGK